VTQAVISECETRTGYYPLRSQCRKGSPNPSRATLSWARKRAIFIDTAGEPGINPAGGRGGSDPSAKASHPLRPYDGSAHPISRPPEFRSGPRSIPRDVGAIDRQGPASRREIPCHGDVRPVAGGGPRGRSRWLSRTGARQVRRLVPRHTREEVIVRSHRVEAPAASCGGAARHRCRWSTSIPRPRQTGAGPPGPAVPSPGVADHDRSTIDAARKPPIAVPPLRATREMTLDASLAVLTGPASGAGKTGGREDGLSWHAEGVRQRIAGSRTARFGPGLPGGRVHRRSLELLTRSPGRERAEETTGSRKFLGNPDCPFAHVPSTPAGLQAPDHGGAVAWPLVSEQQGLPRQVFRRSIA
jgi:hypothetical protein